MSPPTTLTAAESSPSQMVGDGLPNINLDYGKLGSFDAHCSDDGMEHVIIEWFSGETVEYVEVGKGG